MTKEQLLEKLNRHESLQVINVLEDPGKGNRLKLIQGSKHIPLSQLEERIDELDKTKEVVVYCASYECPASKYAETELAAHGFTVEAYEGGIKEWSEAGYPTQ